MPTKQIAFIVFVLLVIAGALYLFMHHRPTTSHMKVPTTNTSNTNSSAPQPLINTNEDSTNTNDSANTNTPADSNSGILHLTVNEVFATPERYSGTRICISGPYEQTSTFNGFGNGTTTNGHDVVAPFIWVYIPVSADRLQCSDPDAAGHQTCFANLTVCGDFLYHPSGGYGYHGQYQYALNAEGTAQ